MENAVIKNLEEEQKMSEKLKENHKTTYIVIGSEETGLLEIDLVTFRQKNDEMRYLSIVFKGIDTRTGQEQDAFINIDNEDAFKELKKFFAQLDWNS